MSFALERGPWMITGTGTGIGKTVVTCALARGAHPDPAIAVKPIETGVEARPEDADALASACGRPALADLPGFIRMRAPLAPHAAALMGEPPVDFDALLSAIHQQLLPGHVHLVEGAGGLLVPVDATRTIADIARALDARVLLVAPEGLGVLSHTLTAHECAWARGLDVAGVILSQHTKRDPSWKTNRGILQELLDCPVVTFPRVTDDAALTAAGVALWGALEGR